MENVEETVNLIREQWTLRKIVTDDGLLDFDYKVIKQRINDAWMILNSTDTKILNEAFDQIIKENKSSIDSIRKGNHEEVTKLLMIKDLYLQNDVLGRGQY